MNRQAVNKQLPLVVIFGRTNVGKSTLFNALVGKRQALVSEIAGTTRDSNIGEVAWRDRIIKLVDTGGIIDLNHFAKTEAGSKRKTSQAASQQNQIQLKIEAQARHYLKQADLILFLVDNKSGLLPEDKKLALLLKKILKDKTGKIILVVNKVDNFNQRARAVEFYKLAFGEPALISAANGSGTGDLLDLIVKKLSTGLAKKKKAITAAKEPREEIAVAVVGQPNVGKSSLVNRLLGQERVLVSPLPHTTREPQDAWLNYKQHRFKLIDTAGISKKGQQAPYKKGELKTALAKAGIAMSLRRLNKADLALLVLDISQPLTHQETKIVDEIISRQKSLLIVANKWDLIENKETKKYTRHIYGRLPFISWVPIEFISARSGQGVKKIFDQIIKIAEQRQIAISPSQLNTFLMKLVKLHKPTKGKGTAYPRIHKFEQISVNPPRFVVRIGAKEDLHFSYLRFLTNRLRQKYGFLGTPLKIEVIKNKKVHGRGN